MESNARHAANSASRKEEDLDGVEKQSAAPGTGKKKIMNATNLIDHFVEQHENK